MEPLAAFVGSVIGVALGVLASVHLWHRSEQRASARREAMRRHPSSLPLDLVEASQYNPRKNAS